MPSCYQTIWLLLIVHGIVVDDVCLSNLLRSKMIDSEQAKCFELLRCSDACDSRFQVYHLELCFDTPCAYGCVYGKREVVFLRGSNSRKIRLEGKMLCIVCCEEILGFLQRNTCVCERYFLV